MNFKISDIRVSINLFFVLILLSAIVAGFQGDMLASISALAIHESAHIFLAKVMGIKIEELEFLPFGGRMKLLFDEETIEAEMITVLAGPMANFAVAGLLLIFIGENVISRQIAEKLIKYQLTLGFFNILPALPLDGGRIFVLWLSQHVNYIEAVRIASTMGKVLALVLLSVAIGGLFFGKSFINFLLIGVFLFIQGTKESKDAPLIFMRQLTKKKENLFKRGYMQTETLVVMEWMKLKSILYLFIPQKYFLVYILDKDMHIKKYFTETEIFDIIVEKGLDIRIRELL